MSEQHPIVETLNREIEKGREIYTNLSPTKRARILQVYPGSSRFEVTLEVVESEFGTDGVGNRITMLAADVLNALGY